MIRCDAHERRRRHVTLAHERRGLREDAIQRLPVISTRLHTGSTLVRAYSDAPLAGFESVEPDLEDVYFSAVAGHLQ